MRGAVEPALSPPVLVPVTWRDGRPLADGTLVEGLPVDAMAELGEGPIIAVDATVGPGVAPQGQDEGPITIFEALSAALSAGSRRRASQIGDRAWLTVTPETDEIGIFEFHQLDRAREVGRIAARAALEQAASR